jgi:tetratricopeptide (TPR) repeat protein
MAQLAGTVAKLFPPVNASAGDSWVTRGAVAKVFSVWHCDAMKFLLLAIGLLAAGLLPARAQQDADDKYIGIYSLLQQADNLAETGDPGEALAAYSDAQRQLLQMQKRFPAWNPNIVLFRLSHVTDKIAELQKHAAPVKKSATPVASETVSPHVVTVTNAADTSALDDLRTQLQVAQTANELLQARLKEALAVQPAAIDPRELEQAREKIRWLMKENDLLNAIRSNAAPAVVTQVVTNFQTVYVTNEAPAIVQQSAPVIVTNLVNVVVADTNALRAAQMKLAIAEKNYTDEHDRAEALALKLKQRPAPAPAAANTDKLSADLQAAQVQVAALQSAAEVAALEKAALERKLQDLSAATNAGSSAAEYESRLRDLTQERDGLIEKLDRANQRGSGNQDSKLQISALTDELGVLRARLAVMEAVPAPFSADEQALFRTAVPQPANPDAGKISVNALPAGTAELVASAQRHFAHQEFDAAEADYLKILERDQNNGIVLANLATIELQADKLADAEKHITAAVALSPNDAYNLSTLGYLKFRQEKFDDALDALSRAAQIDPNNPEIQNYLGVTLSHKGQRKAAESALRRALQLSPNYAPAHNNLAVIYLSQTPAWPEMARWHYQKALDAGQPRNADLEKMLADKGAPVAP